MKEVTPYSFTLFRSLRSSRLCGLFVAATLLPSVGLSQFPSARLLTVFPPGGKAGTTVEVEVTGQDLDDLRALEFSNANLTAKHLSGAKFTISIPTNIAPGLCDCRAVGRHGISNPRPFAIGQLSESVAGTTNKSADQAISVAINTTINSQAASEGIQFFKFSAKKEQRILIECDAESLDSRMAPSMLLLDDSGRELARNHPGDLLEIRPNADSNYLLKVHDFLFRGGAEYFYRLTLSTLPHIDYIIPGSAVPGTKEKLTLFGRNLPNGIPAKDVNIDRHPLEQLTVEIDVPKHPETAGSTSTLLKPAAAFARGFDYRLESANGLSNPFFISFAAAPVVSEQEPNDQPSQAQKLVVPCEVSGQLYPAGDRDWFSFDAKKGETFWVEAISQRLGAQTDPFLLIQRITRNAKGEEESSDVQEIYDSESPGGKEFQTGGLDPAARFSAKEDGTYRIEVRDQFRSVDPRNIYRLAVRKESPDFELAVIPQPAAPAKKDAKDAPIAVSSLRRGQTIALKLAVLKRDGFKEDIEVSTKGLPSTISVSHPQIAAATNSALLFLTASESASNWTGSCRIVGTAKPSGLVREARATTVLWNSPDTSVEPLQTRFTRNFALAISADEPAPVVITAADDKVFESTVGGKLQIPLRIGGRTKLASALKLKAIGVPGLDATKELDVDAKATNATLQLEFQKVKAGDYELVLQSQAQGKLSTKGSDKSKDVTLNVYSAPIRLKIAPAAVAKANDGK